MIVSWTYVEVHGDWMLSKLLVYYQVSLMCVCVAPEASELVECVFL